MVEFDTDAIENVLLGSGDDLVYVRDGVSTVATIHAGTGTDLLSYAETGHTWTSNVRVELSTGKATGTGGVLGFEDITGGDADDYLEGDDAANRISGGNGVNELVGLGGDDTLIGGDNDDTLKGGADNDTLIAYGGTNSLIGGTGDDTYLWYAGYEPKDVITEVAGEGSDTMSFASVSTAIQFDIDATILATYGTAAITATDATGIDRVTGGSRADRFVLADGVAFGGLLDGGGVQSIDFADMNILDYSLWTAPVTVDYTGQLDANFTTAVTGAGSVRWLQHVIGGLKDDSLTAGDQPVWFEGNDGDDTLNGSSQADLLEGNAGSDTISALAGNDFLRGGTGTDTLAGGTGDDTYAFADVFGNDTILENPGEGDDTMDFSAVLAALQIRLGSVTVTDSTSTATHAGDDIEMVIGGQADDEFVMTNSSVTFPGTLNGSGGTNSLVYEKARDPIIDAVDRGETPNIGTVLNISSVTAEPIYKRIEVTVAKGAELIDTTVYKGDERIVKKGLGRLILASANTHSGGVLVEEGEVVIRDPAALGGGGLEITGTATTTLDLAGGTLALSRLKLSSGTRLELGDGSLTVGGGGFTAVDIRQAIIAGRNGGSWDGTTGITSAAAGTQGGASIAATNTFGIGYTIDGSGMLKIETVLEGDTDLDGSVDFDDILALFPNYNVAGSYTWQGGDITYDGAVDFDDILALFPNYGTTLGAGASGLGTGGGGGSGAGLLGFGGGSGSGTANGSGDGTTSTGFNGSASGDQSATGPAASGDDAAAAASRVMGPQPPDDLVTPPRTTLFRYASDPSGDATSDATSLAFAALAAEQDQASSGSKKTTDRLFATL
jgi:Ca2+-binding RTX toxin-like protein